MTVRQNPAMMYFLTNYSVELWPTAVIQRLLTASDVKPFPLGVLIQEIKGVTETMDKLYENLGKELHKPENIIDDDRVNEKMFHSPRTFAPTNTTTAAAPTTMNNNNR